jgi:hypothetical protein
MTSQRTLLIRWFLILGSVLGAWPESGRYYLHEETRIGCHGAMKHDWRAFRMLKER